jgi:hypothetical protein
MEPDGEYRAGRVAGRPAALSPAATSARPRIRADAELGHLRESLDRAIDLLGARDDRRAESYVRHVIRRHARDDLMSGVQVLHDVGRWPATDVAAHDARRQLRLGWSHQVYVGEVRDSVLQAGREFSGPRRHPVLAYRLVELKSIGQCPAMLE